jgi:hypothetical protein
MTATVAGIHLGVDTHGNRPAGNAVPDGSLYSCSTHSLVYKSSYGGNSWSTWATLGTTVADGFLQSSIATRTAGDVTTSSTSFVDLTDMTVTLTTGAHRCLVYFNASANSSVAGGNVCFDVDIDGTPQGQTYGLAVVSQSSHAGAVGINHAVAITYLTPVLSSASHTIKIRWRVDGTQTGTLFASAGVTPAILTVIETGLTS